jgi:hypothetical protein
MQRSANSTYLSSTHKRETREVIELKHRITELEQTVMEMNFNRALIIKENEDKAYQIEKLKKQRDVDIEKIKKEKEIEIQKIKHEYQSVCEENDFQTQKLRKEIEILKREKEIETEILKKEKESEILRIKEEYENEQQKGKNENVEFIYKLKTEFFPATPYVETKLLEENREKIKKLEQEKQNMRVELGKLNKASSTVLRSRSNKKIC